MSEWNDEIRGDLRSLHETGISGREIATEINRKHGTTFTKNAVVGQVHRMGLASRGRASGAKHAQAIKRGKMNKAAGEKPKRRPRATYSVKALPARKFNGSFSNSPVETAPVMEFGGEPSEAAGIGIMELRSHTCRWPLSSFMDHPPYRYCGRPKLVEDGVDTQYCEHHYRVARSGSAPRTIGATYHEKRRGR